MIGPVALPRPVISGELQDLIGRCMSLEAALHKPGFEAEESLVCFARKCLAKAAARLEIPLEVKDA